VGVRARVDERAEVALEGDVRAGRRARFGLDDAVANVDPGIAQKLKLRLGSGEARRIRRKLKHGRGATARVEGVATDPGGNVSDPSSLKIRLAR